MSVMDALGVAAKCWEVAMMVYQQYQTQKEVAASVGQYVSIVKLYQSSLKRLMTYIQQEQNNTVRINDPQWSEDMKTFGTWAEEDAKDAAYLQHELEKIRDNKWWKNMFIQAQDRFQEHQTRMYKKLEIIKFFMTMDMWKAGNKDRKDIDFAITDEEGRYFWHEHIGSGKREVTVEGLVGALQQFLSETQKFRSIEQQLLGVLKVTADTIVSNDQITIYEYNSFICRFGPLANILKKASAVCTIDGTPQPWFRAIADRRKLELEFASQLATYDCEHPDETGATSPKLHGFNTWVLRFSSEPREHFVWSYMHNRKPFHVLIRNSPKGYHLKDLPKGHTEHKYYETVIDLIDAESERMNFKVDKSHLREWQDLFDYNTAEDPEGESRYATFAADDDDDDDEVSSPSTAIASPEKVALTVDNSVKDPATAEKVSAIAAAIIQQHETTTSSTPTTQTIIETKATEKHEPQNMTIIIDRVEQNGTTTTPAPAETPVPAATTTTTSPSSSNAPAASSPTSTSSDDHVDANAAKSAAAAADALEKSKDIVIATPDPRASKPKPSTDEDTRGPAEQPPKPVKSCCAVM